MGNNRGDIAQMVALIERTAVEVAAQEEQLRHRLISLIRQGHTKEAVEILQAWEHMAPGDVLKQFVVTDGNQN